MTSKRPTKPTTPTEMEPVENNTVNKNSEKQKRNTYSNEFKKEIIKYKDDNQNSTIESISKRFNMPIGTVHRTLKNKDKINVNKKGSYNITENRKFKSLDEPLYDWFVNQRILKNSIDNQDLLKEASEIAKRLGV